MRGGSGQKRTGEKVSPTAQTRRRPAMLGQQVRREVVAQLRQQRDPPFRRVVSDFQEETAGRRSKGDGEGLTTQIYTGSFERLEAFCARDELAEVTDVEYVAYEEHDVEVVERVYIWKGDKVFQVLASGLESKVVEGG